MRSPVLRASDVRMIGAVTTAVSVVAILGIVWIASQIRFSDFGIDQTDYDGD